MEQTNKPQVNVTLPPMILPEWCKSWVTIKEAALIIEKAGVPYWNAGRLYRAHQQSKAPFAFRQFGKVWYIERRKVEEYVQTQLAGLSLNPER